MKFSSSRKAVTEIRRTMFPMKFIAACGSEGGVFSNDLFLAHDQILILTSVAVL